MKILLVEDEKGVANFIKKGLAEENYSIDLAIDGEEGFHLAISGLYDLIILDVGLPKMDGFEICEKLREQAIQTPLLMLTAKIEVKDKVRGLDAGADDYLTKPFSFEELLARVRALLRRKKDPMLELKVGVLRLEPHARRVFIEDKEVFLRPKEYAILEFLTRNRGQVVSRTRIIENVWDYNFDTGTNLVDAHIKTLRKELSNYSSAKIIRTIRGMGYLLEEIEVEN